MKHIHAREYLSGRSTVRVDCDHQCNVLLMDDRNYTSYRSGRRFEHYGGSYTHFPALIGVPRSNHWNVVIDLGGRSANIRYDISYLG